MVIDDLDAKVLREYWEKIKDHRLLSRKEEINLAERIHKGDTEARDELVESNLRFVVDHVTRYKDNGLSMMELVQVGNLGLLEAAERFDETRGFKFISYAVFWVRKEVLEALNGQYGNKIPIDRLNNLRKLMKGVDGSFSEYMTPDEISEILKREGEDMSEKEIYEALEAGRARSSVSLDATPFNDSDETYGDLFIDASIADPLEPIIMRESRRDFPEFVYSCLENDREVDIVTRYYGLDGKESETLDQLANFYEMTREGIRQIKLKSLRTLIRRSSESSKGAYEDRLVA